MNSEVDGRIKADHLLIEFDESRLQQDINTSQRLKLYHASTLPQKIQIWLIIGLTLTSLTTNVVSIASSVDLLPRVALNCTAAP